MAAIIGRPVTGGRSEEWRLAARVRSRFLAALGTTGREAKAAAKVQGAEKARRSRFPKGMTERKAEASAEAKTEASAEAKTEASAEAKTEASAEAKA